MQWLAKRQFLKKDFDAWIIYFVFQKSRLQRLASGCGPRGFHSMRRCTKVSAEVDVNSHVFTDPVELLFVSTVCWGYEARSIEGINDDYFDKQQ
jgi:hypothetical protein